MVKMVLQESLAELVMNASFRTDLIEFIHHLFTIEMIRYKVYHRNLAGYVVYYWSSILPRAVHAHGNLYNEKYGDVKGKQSLAISYIALAYASKPNVQWTPKLLTELLDAGTELHTQLHEQQQNADDTELAGDQKIVFQFDNIIFKVEEKIIQGGCDSTHEFKTRVMNQLDKGHSVVFSFKDSYYGIFKQTREINKKNTVVYCLIDSYGIFTGRAPNKPRVLVRGSDDAIILEYGDFNGLYDLIDSTLLKWARHDIEAGGALTVTGYSISFRDDGSETEENVIRLGARSQAIESS